MNKTRWTLLGILMVFLLASVTVLGTKVFEEPLTVEMQRGVEALVSDNGEIGIDSFAVRPERMQFTGSNRLEILGDHKDFGLGLYEVDLLEMAIAQVTSFMDAAEIDRFQVMASTPYGMVLIEEDGRPGLYHKSLQGKLVRISSSFVPGEAPEFKLSDDASKLIYYVSESDQLATYDLAAQKKKVIPGRFTETVAADFQNSVSLSPLGEYFMIYDSRGDLRSHTLNVYGADSGRLYAGDIQGVLPVWAPDDRRLAFVYSGQLADSTEVTGTRVGYIKLPEKEIVYYDKLGEDEIVAKPLFWDHTGQKAAYYRKNRDKNGFDLVIYNVTDGSLGSLNFDEGISKGGKVPDETYIDDIRIVMYWANDSSIRIFDMDGVELDSQARIDTIFEFGFDGMPFVANPDGVLYGSDGQMILTSGKGREVYRSEVAESALFSGDASWIVTGQETGDGYMLKVLPRLKP